MTELALIYLAGMVATGVLLGLIPIEKGDHKHIQAAVLSAAFWPGAAAIVIVGYLSRPRADAE
jgi:hypothetical protein